MRPRVGVIVVGATVLGGCWAWSLAAFGQQSQTDRAAASREAAAQTVATVPQIELRRDSAQGVLEVWARDGDQNRLVRVIAAVESLPPDEEARLREREQAALVHWSRCVARLRQPQASADDRHDACLEACTRLEQAAAADPTHRLLQRDLLATSVALLSYERGTPFAISVCRSACLHFDRFSRQLRSKDDADLALVASARAWLLIHKKLYPAAQESLAAIASQPERQAVRAALRALQQDAFIPIESWEVGARIVRAYRTVGRSPDADLVWPECHFIVTSPAEPSEPSFVNPAHSAGYAVSVRSVDGLPRFDLRFHAFGGTTLLQLYGDQRPSYSLVKQHVTKFLRAALLEESNSGGRKGENP